MFPVVYILPNSFTCKPFTSRILEQIMNRLFHSQRLSPLSSDFRRIQQVQPDFSGGSNFEEAKGSINIVIFLACTAEKYEVNIRISIIGTFKTCSCSIRAADMNSAGFVVSVARCECVGQWM